MYLAMLRDEARDLVVRYHRAILRVADELERVAVLAGIGRRRLPSSFLGNSSYKKLRYWYEGESTWFDGEPRTLTDTVQGDIVVMNVMSQGSYQL